MADLKKRPLNFNKKLYQFLAVLEAERLHRKYHFAMTWAMMAHSCGVPAGIFKRFHPEVKYLLTLQEGDPSEYIEKLMKPVWPLFVQGFKRADALQAISTYLLTWGKRMGFAGEAQVIPNAVDVAHFAQPISSEERRELRKKLGIREGEVVLVSTSRLVHKNALDDVIRALAHLPETIRFINFGVGTDTEELQVLADTLQLSDRVSLLPHPGNETLPTYLQACDIFIRPSRSEGMGISFLEAMAAGLPVIATQEGGIADFLFDAKRNPEKETTGWAVDVNAPEQIAVAITDILSNPEITKRVVAHARAQVVEKYDWNLIAREMKELFNSLLTIS